MADPIRAALERLVAASRFPGLVAALKYQRARDAALAVLAAHPATTPSLAELVTPKPGYQPGTGREDGAQLVGSANGPEWWAPESGCDSLDITLDAIRSRIAPYLREPVAGEVLAAPTPPANGEVEELIWRLGWIAAQCADIGWSDDSASVARAAALLREARPQPVPVSPLYEAIPLAVPHGDEIEKIAGQTLAIETPGIHAFARQLLEQYARPRPVPVGERSWERPGWLDAEGRCWLRGKVEGDWRLMTPANVPQLRYAFDFSLPHWAIPQPTEPTTPHGDQ